MTYYFFFDTTEYTSTCAWNPTENILASTRKNESVCLNFGPKLSDITSLLLEGNNQTSQSGGQDHRLAWNVIMFYILL